MGRKLLLLLPLLLLSTSCRKKEPAAPPEFASDIRAMTGNAPLENRISEAMELEALSDEELAALKEKGLQVGQTAALSRWVRASLGRGTAQESVDVLLSRAWGSLSDDIRVADIVDVTMGRLEWGACAQVARSILERRASSDLFLVRALCLRRFGDAVGAQENLEAAHTTEPLTPEVKATVAALLDERASGDQLPPADEARYEVLARGLERRGPIARLFVQHLTERADPGWSTGTLIWDDVSATDLSSVIGSRARSYRHCHALADYNGERGAPELKGSATVQWFVDGLGRVTEAQVSESDWNGHPQADWLNACLVDQVQHLRFPTPKYGRPLPARHRFSFGS